MGAEATSSGTMQETLARQRAAFAAELPVSALTRKDRLRRALDLLLDGRDFVATAGDLIRLPMNIPHGIFNKSDQTANACCSDNFT